MSAFDTDEEDGGTEMVRKTIIALVMFAAVMAIMFSVGCLLDSDVSVPKPITAEAACPATDCANGICHGYADIPLPDGVHEMTCPEAQCASVECHAWDSLTGRYHQASNASLNLWILFPAVLTIALLALVRTKR